MHNVDQDNHRHGPKPPHRGQRGAHHHAYHKHHGHHHHSDYEEEENETALFEFYGELEQKEGLNLLIDLLKTLKNNGQVNLSDHQVSITDDIGFSITHEETWDETEKLTLEIEWTPENDDSSGPEDNGAQLAPTIS